jgi:hypothetical protein
MNINAKPILGRTLIDGDLVESESGDVLEARNTPETKLAG